MSEDNCIEKGDMISLGYSNGNILYNLRVEHVPQDVGDWWYFSLTDKTGLYTQDRHSLVSTDDVSKLVAINPTSPAILSIEKGERDERGNLQE